MKLITSTANPEIKKVASLGQAKNRYEEKKFIAEGFRTISTLIDGGMVLVQLYVTEHMLDQAQSLTDASHITQVSENVLKKMSQASTPSGILGVFKMPMPLAPHTLTDGLVMAQISDPGNMGTLIRTCAAMNVKSVIVIEGVDPFNPKVIQASAGTIAYVHIYQLQWHELLENKGKLKLQALVVTGGKNLKEVKPHNALIVVGSEAHGIPEQWIEDCDGTITILMPGRTESLNAAIAGSITLYELFSRD